MLRNYGPLLQHCSAELRHWNAAVIIYTISARGYINNFFQYLRSDDITYSILEAIFILDPDFIDVYVGILLKRFFVG